MNNTIEWSNVLMYDTTRLDRPSAITYNNPANGLLTDKDDQTLTVIVRMIMPWVEREYIKNMILSDSLTSSDSLQDYNISKTVSYVIDSLMRHMYPNYFWGIAKGEVTSIFGEEERYFNLGVFGKDRIFVDASITLAPIVFTHVGPEIKYPSCEVYELLSISNIQNGIAIDGNDIDPVMGLSLEDILIRIKTQAYRYSSGWTLALDKFKNKKGRSYLRSKRLTRNNLNNGADIDRYISTLY